MVYMKALVRSALLFIPSCCMVFYAHAQDTTATSPADTVKKVRPPAPARVAPPGPRPITHELSFGYRFHTLGGSAYVDLGRVKFQNARQSDMFYRVNHWQLEFSEKRSPKQEKLVAEGGSGGSAK